MTIEIAESAFAQQQGAAELTKSREEILGEATKRIAQARDMAPLLVRERIPPTYQACEDQ